MFDNKVVVSQPPDLLVYTDVDRDLALLEVDGLTARVKGARGAPRAIPAPTRP